MHPTSGSSTTTARCASCWRTALREAGYRVREFGDAGAALDARGLAPSPAGSGLHRRAHARRPAACTCSTKLKQAATERLPVIVMSAWTDVASTAGAFRGGAHDFLSKPFDLDDRRRAGASRAAAGRRDRELPASTPPQEGRRIPRPARRCAPMRELFRAIGRLAQAPLSVLITGETGTGKELVARALHRAFAARVASLRCAQHRGDPGRTAGERTVRPRGRRLHRRRQGAISAASNKPTAAPCSSTRSATCPLRCRRACCACWPRASSSVSAGAS
jgi:CheY-like chemotaxis protein